MMAWIRSTSAPKSRGARKFIMAFTTEKVWAEENVSVDIQKVKQAKRITGSST